MRFFPISFHSQDRHKPCRIEKKLDIVIGLLKDLDRKADRIMAKLSELLNEVEQNTTLATSVTALLAQIKTQLDAITAGGLTPEAQKQVDDMFAKLNASNTKIGEAIIANTPNA